MSVTLEDLEKIDLIIEELINRKKGNHQVYAVSKEFHVLGKKSKEGIEQGIKKAYGAAAVSLIKDDPSFIVDSLNEPPERFEQIFGVTPTEAYKRYKDSKKDK